MARSLIDIMRRAMLPLDGNIAGQIPAILAAYARIVPEREWRHLTVVDLTAGSCLLPLLSAARGVGRLIVNDPAERSYVAARALFGGWMLDRQLVRRLVTARSPRLHRHVPSFHFASDYLTEDVADTYDRLYYARLKSAARPVYRYLALRWVLGFAPTSDDGSMNILPTHDYRQLLADRDHDWRPFVRRARARLSILDALTADINAAIARIRTRHVAIHRDDLLILCRRLDYGHRTLVMVNPPTNGVDEYVLDDQFAHSLLANRWLPLSRSGETAADFWVRRVSAALKHLPRGSHAVVWGGDGALTWDQCLEVWTRYAAPTTVRRVRDGNRRPGWAILAR